MAGRELTITPTKRERRKSPAISPEGTLQTPAPPSLPAMSPTSSVGDSTFEPTIEMMVNDFDDEATLNEEEALADLEAHNPEDEIATLQEESEMPIEQLLAKYSRMTVPSPPCPSTSTSTSPSLKRASSSSRRRRPPKRIRMEDNEMEAATSSTAAGEEQEKPSEAAEQPPEELEEDDDDLPLTLPTVSTHPEHSTFRCAEENEEMTGVLSPEVNKKPHRSHLLDLYPDESFGNKEQPESFTALQTLFEQVDAGEEDGEEEEDSDTDSDDARKTIMVGGEYQAEIPEELSQYGDILPYENEDQLIWEPSQVSEREVEDYLAKILHLSLTAAAEEAAAAAAAVAAAGELEDDATTPKASPSVAPATVAASPNAAAAAPNSEQDSVVRDNEQALHLLVQCGYDFKEALRRKRLNVLPLSDTMSSWSEEECQKFEEGIQKFGKDFYQIRQNQVRTRTMRELVQFYYLWKKSERRDQSFALNDTIDHMDVFINEAAGNGVGIVSGNGIGSCSSSTSSTNSNGHCNGNGNLDQVLEKDPAASTARKTTTKNYSIMTGSQAGAATGSGAGVGAGAGRKRAASIALDENNEDNADMVIDSIS